MEIHRSARNGVGDADIIHAIGHVLVEDAGEGTDRLLVIGSDRAGNLLEVVVLTTSEGRGLVINAMPMRARFARLIER